MLRPNAAIISAIIFVFAAVFLFGASMSKPCTNDEHMYCTAGVLTAAGDLIYRDFSYVAQLPFHPMLYAAIYKLTNTDHYLLVGRITSVVCDLLVALLIFVIYLRAFDKSHSNIAAFFGLAAVLLNIFNSFVNYASGRAWNHDVIIALAVTAFWLYTIALPKRLWPYFLMGMLLTIATFMRITTVIIWFVMACFIAFQTVPRIQQFKMFGMFIIGSIMAAIWPLWVIAQAPHAFYINLVWIPTLNGAFLHKIGLAFAKPAMIWHAITQPSYAVLWLLAIAILSIAIVRSKQIANYRMMFLAITIALGFVLIALIPPTMWYQYFAPPVPFILISLAFPLAAFVNSAMQNNFKVTLQLTQFAFILAIIVSIAANSGALLSIPFAFNTSQWVPTRVHNAAQQLCQKAGTGKPILTLAPLYALEGGCKIYPQLSSGPFACRVADFMSPADRKAANVVSPQEITPLTLAQPPAAVIIDNQPQFLLTPLLAQTDPNWPRETVYSSEPIEVFFRPVR